jgi:hypothetical protein
MSDIAATPVFGTADGWAVGIRSPAFWAWFQSEGTLSNFRRKLKQPGRRRRAAPPGSGITALHFFGRGRAIARKSLLRELARF